MEQLLNINTSFKSTPVTSKFTPDEGPGKHRIGLVVLSNDYATEQDFISARPNDDVAIFVSRVPNTSDCKNPPAPAGTKPTRKGRMPPHNYTMG